jgi:hypothetical protein
LKDGGEIVETGHDMRSLLLLWPLSTIPVVVRVKSFLFAQTIIVLSNEKRNDNMMAAVAKRDRTVVGGAISLCG